MTGNLKSSDWILYLLIGAVTKTSTNPSLSMLRQQMILQHTLQFSNHLLQNLNHSFFPEI
jgi:hypothetical protein